MQEDQRDLDAEVDAILQRERERKASREAKQKTAADSEATLIKSLERAFAKADKAHRLATERVEVRVFDC